MGKLVIAAAVALSLMQSRTERLAVPGGEVAYDTAGSGPAVVFLHGAFMDRRSWDRQMPEFSRRFRVVRYDLRPFGESSRPDKAYSVPDDLLRLLDHLKIARAHLVGHSFGGGTALDFALLHPDRVASLVLAAAGPSGFVASPEEQKAAMAVFAAVKNGDDAIVKAWLEHPIWSVVSTRPDLRKELDAMTRRSLGAFQMTFAPYIPVKPAAMTRLGDVRAPTLIVIGDRDTPDNRRAAELMAKEIPGATLRVIKGADHALPLGWSEEFNEAALAFLSRVAK